MSPSPLVPATLDRIAGDIAHNTARLGRIAAAGGGVPYLAKNGTVQYAGADRPGPPGQPLPDDGYAWIEIRAEPEVPVYRQRHPPES